MSERVAMVTGASGGIGHATAAALGAAGHSVGVCYRSDAEGAAAAAAAVEAAGGKAVVVQADVADPNAVDQAFKEVEAAFGPVTLLVNNAGATQDGLLLRMSDDAWRNVISTNLDGAFFTIRRATPGMMKARFGRVVNIGSVVGLTGSAGQVNYAAAKAGLLGLTRSVARELASRNVTCNLVTPGPIATAMMDALTQDRQDDLAKLTALGRLGSPDEVAATVAFLCSDPAGYITGAVIPVDGGLSMGH